MKLDFVRLKLAYLHGYDLFRHGEAGFLFFAFAPIGKIASCAKEDMLSIPINKPINNALILFYLIDLDYKLPFPKLWYNS